MLFVYVLIQTLASAFLNRVRGGWTGGLPFGATTARIIWATGTSAPFVVLALWFDVFSWWLVLLPIALWLGTVMGWQGSLDLGRNEDSYWRDFGVMTARGVLWTLPAAAVLAWVYGAVVGIPMLIAGALCAVLYELGWHMPAAWKPPFARGPEMGEILFGAAIGLALAFAMIFVII